MSLFTKVFLVQSFKETLQYCDERRKFTSVSHSVSQSASQSISHSVNFPGGAMIRAYFVAYFKMFAVNVFQNFETVLINTTTPRTYMWLLSKPVRFKKRNKLF